MSGVVAIGKLERLQGFALAGVQLIAADDPEAARAAWRALPEDVELAILTSAVHAALAAEGQDERDRRLWAVIADDA